MKKVKLSKKFQVRDRLFRNQLSSLILFEQITTTDVKAKALKAKASSFIARLKRMDNEVNTKRYINSYLYGGARLKAFDYRDKFECVRTFRLSKNRFGDNAQQTIVKLVILQAENNSKQPKNEKDKTKDKK